MTTDNVSRRGFLAGATGLALAGVASMAGCASNAADNNAVEGHESLASTQTFDKQADVVIVGAGMAALFAAMNASEEGATVLMLEKAPEAEAGGDSRCFGGIISNIVDADTQMQRAMYEMPKDVAVALSDNEADINEWFHENTDLEWVTPGICDGAGLAAWQAVMEIVGGYDSITIEYETPAKRLIKDEDGKTIIGVIAEKNGDEIRIGANKGVILATGGYEANNKLLNRFQYPGMEIFTVGSPHVTGDGMIMALEAGAAIEQMGQSLDWFEFAYAVPSRQYGTGITSRLWDTTDIATYGNSNTNLVNSRIFVDMNGDRFMDEIMKIVHNKENDLPFMEIVNPSVEGDGKFQFFRLPFFMVCDQACIDSAPLGLVPNDASWEWTHTQGIYRWSDDNSAEIDAGWLLKADTLEELATMMTATTYMTGETRTMNTENFIATVKAYNENCAKGEDPFRLPETLVPLSQPPYYAIEMAPCAVYTIGGVRYDANSQVVDWDDNPIPGLFAAGNIGQGTVRPIGVTGCIARGRVAGTYVAKLPSRGEEA